MAHVTCQDCGTSYDDTYRLTYCPHERFAMQTVAVRADGQAHVCSSVEQLESFLRQPERSRNMNEPRAIHPATLQVLKYFAYEHLPLPLQAISEPFSALAWKMAMELPESPEVTVGLRKLLEANDCFVRAALP